MRLTDSETYQLNEILRVLVVVCNTLRAGGNGNTKLYPDTKGSPTLQNLLDRTCENCASFVNTVAPEVRRGTQ
jgi:hypothetical protein